ncbi:MAG: hypothetical protein ICV79_26575 [Flavisolibacter sp.]|nr:hypothetical protein [Flavisolibacter sp.]
MGRTHDFTQGSQSPLQQQDLLYVEADGSMILTRSQGCKEVKAGRVFKSSDCLDADGRQGRITHSPYLTQMGGLIGALQKRGKPSLKMI